MDNVWIKLMIKNRKKYQELSSSQSKIGNRLKTRIDYEKEGDRQIRKILRKSFAKMGTHRNERKHETQETKNRHAPRNQQTSPHAAPFVTSQRPEKGREK